MSTPRFGANYTPRLGWFHHWLEFDASEIAAHLADHPNFLGMSLGNEVSQFAASVHPDPEPATPAQA
ncbi:MAG TPA: hypothetical protein VK098_01120 [Beutenbergiaceae bacterium]|nr:hypothetical protein [Beutenbergiaceae bacterium]